ncbi:MAG: ABC transporter substrate-binding protein [Phycisphaerales bacterium]
MPPTSLFLATRRLVFRIAATPVAATLVAATLLVATWFATASTPVANAADVVQPGRGGALVERFSAEVGDVAVGPVRDGGRLEMPFILWGGDVATFHANGGLQTTPDSRFGAAGLAVDLRPGDDFPEQVRRYLRGDSPFLRGTMRMLGLASEVIGRDPRTKPVVFLQLSFSEGDHLLGREPVRQTKDLAGRRVAVQRSGPHVGMLDDMLRSAGLGWNDIEVVWCDTITGEGSPAAAFAADSTIAACTVVTPDMLALVGDLDAVGSGAEGTVAGARVINSTAYASRSITDVYAVRRDWYDANRATVDAMLGGWLQSSVELESMRDAFESTGRMTPPYQATLTQAQTIFGADVLPTIEVDTHGLLLDANFADLADTERFFTRSGFVAGFQRKMAQSIDLASTLGAVGQRMPMDAAATDFAALSARTGLARFEAQAQAESFQGLDDLEVTPESVLVQFTIEFDPDQRTFPIDRYRDEFRNAVEQAGLYGNSVVVVRGHSDPTKTLGDMVRAGMSSGVIKRSGQRGEYTYFYEGKQVDIGDPAVVERMVRSGAFSGQGSDPMMTMQAALNLSQQRAEAVREALISFAGGEGLDISAGQFQSQGVGIAEPLVRLPRNASQAAKNRRVEFAILRISAESLTEDDFDF